MPKRVRLTKRQAAEDNTPYSGDVGNADRIDPAPDAYSVDDYEVPGWELQEKGNPAKDDKRIEPLNVPEMSKTASETVIKVRQAASKAVKLAVLFLGDKVSQKTIEDQAKEFMRLGSTSLNNALKRYAETETLYAKDDLIEEEEVEEACVKSNVKADGEMEVAEDDAPDSAEENIEEEVFEQPMAEEEIISENVEEIPLVNEMDIELSETEDEVNMSDEEEAELASLYAEDDLIEEEEIEEAPVARKAGIKKLGGQPKVASTKKGDFDLTKLWKTEPDINELF